MLNFIKKKFIAPGRKLTETLGAQRISSRSERLSRRRRPVRGGGKRRLGQLRYRQFSLRGSTATRPLQSDAWGETRLEPCRADLMKATR